MTSEDAVGRTGGLVGREREQRFLSDLLDRARDQGAAVVVRGDAGIGKTTLLRAAVQRARDGGLLVLETAGVQAEAQLPYAGLYQLLHPVLADIAALPLGQQRALRAAFGFEEGPPPEPFLIALASLTLLTDLAATRPVLVAVDDVQWLDGPSHDALAFIARRISRDPVVIVATVRNGHGGSYVEAGLPDIEVVGLDDTAARALLAAHAGGLSFADRERILREALGNPLALVELPAAWRVTDDASGLPPSVLPLTARLERSFAGRLGDLPAAARDAILIAAVNTVDELPEILAAATVLVGRPVSTQDLDSATAAGLIRFDELRVTFRHPLVRSAVLRAETVGRRHAAHRALAEVLRHEPFRRTWHRAQSIVGVDDEVADELQAGSVTALRRGSVSAAIWALERAAQLSSDPAARGRRLLLAAEHAFGQGRADLVSRLLTDAVRGPLSELDLSRVQWLREIFNDGVPGDATRVLELCDIAERSAKADDVDLALNLLQGAALRCWWADAGPGAAARVVEVTRALPAAATDPRALAALGTADPVGQCGWVRHNLASIAVESVTDGDALRLLGMAAKAIGDPVRAIDFFDRAETRLREQGRLGLLSHVLTMQILERLELGEWDRAAAAMEEGQRVARDTGQPIWNTGTQSLHAVILGLRGERDRALELAAQVEKAANRQHLNDLLACVQLARGFAWLSTGEHNQAYAELRRLFDPTDGSFDQAERLHAVMFLAEAAVHAGQRDDARLIVDELAALEPSTPSTTLRIHLSYARAVLADDHHAEALFLAALEQDLVRWPWPKARLQLAYGSWLRRQRRVAESREPLRAARTTLELIGATPWATQAHQELRAAGERDTAAHPRAGQAILSAQELEIARLAAQGLSNREIGQRLFLSPRTVGSHLYRIFPKLNITTRTALRDALSGTEDLALV